MNLGNARVAIGHLICGIFSKSHACLHDVDIFVVKRFFTSVLFRRDWGCCDFSARGRQPATVVSRAVFT